MENIVSGSVKHNFKSKHFDVNGYSFYPERGTIVSDILQTKDGYYIDVTQGDTVIEFSDVDRSIVENFREELLSQMEDRISGLTS